MNSIAIVGLGFGDEGKGNFINYMANQMEKPLNSIKFGGCQGRHTVKLSNGKQFSFSQLSPSIQVESAIILHKSFIFEPFALINEADALSKVIGVSIESILRHIWIDRESICVTPYHKLYNIIEEESNNKRGSVGTGVSIASKYAEDGITLRFKDLAYKKHLDRILESQREFFINKCKEKGYNCEEILNYNISVYTSDLLGLLHIYHINQYVESSGKFGTNLYECSQGVLLDRNFGIKPNITYLDTTCNTLNNIENLRKIGIIRSLYTRHGMGVFPTESDELGVIISDNSQEVGKYSGKIRFGYFDMVLYRYALRVSKVSEVFMSCLDYLNKLSSIKVCTSYLYKGNIDEDFYSTFDYKIQGGNCYIYNIKENNTRLKEFLEQCVPSYIEFGLIGKSFPDNVETYLHYIEKGTGVSITRISFGTNLEDIVERGSDTHD